jgi:small subunit ribosomal protein S19
MTRSIWKGNFINNYILSNKFLKKTNKHIWARNNTISENLIGQLVSVYNGKEFIKFYITREKLGFKFGEFSPTRRFTKKEQKSKTKK